MTISIGDDTVLLDLTARNTEGFDLVFRATPDHLVYLRNEFFDDRVEDRYVVVLRFEDLHPVGDRIENYLTGTEYDSIGVTKIGADHTRRRNSRETEVELRVRCNPSHLRRFASLNRLRLEPPITFTAEVPPKNAESFVEAVNDIERKYGH